MPEAPRPSPRPRAAELDAVDPDSPVTGVHPATRDFARAVSRSGLWTVAVGVGSFALACFLAGITVNKSMAQSARDAGVGAAAEVKKQADATDDRLTRLQTDFTEHVEVESAARVRMEKKLNALLEHEGVKDPAPTPKDGGR